MLQRIQTLYWSLIVILSIGLGYELWTNPIEIDTKIHFLDPMMLFFSDGLLGLLTIICIVLFTNRSLQRILALIIIIVSIAIMAQLGVIIFTTNNHLLLVNYIEWISSFLILFFSIMAYRGIQKDIVLIKSADRLR